MDPMDVILFSPLKEFRKSRNGTPMGVGVWCLYGSDAKTRQTKEEKLRNVAIHAYICKPGCRHAACAAKALPWRVEKLPNCLI